MSELGRDLATLTAEELFLVTSDQDERHELERGSLVRMPPPGALHGQICSQIAHLLREHAATWGAGVVCVDTGFILARGPDTVRGPDVSFVARERIPSDGVPVGYWSLAPDLAVEVLSPWQRVGELDARIAEYFAAGTRLLWVVHPNTRTVHAFRSPSSVEILTEEREIDGGDVLAGFRCHVRRFFE
jgi:Uma2 family endonuclease